MANDWLNILTLPAQSARKSMPRNSARPRMPVTQEFPRDQHHRHPGRHARDRFALRRAGARRESVAGEEDERPADQDLSTNGSTTRPKADSAFHVRAR